MKKAKAKPRSKRASASFRLYFSDGVGPRTITAANKEAAEKAGRRLSAAFAFAKPIS